jgi:Fe-S cluster assembly protein SufD
VATGGAIARFQGFITIAGEGARLGANGTMMLGEKAHGDVSLVIDHAAEGARSRVLYKNVADGESEGAFQGLIIVRPGAQKTDGRMMSRSLLLSDRAEFSAKPELEIYADDVQCGHGATSGRIDDEMLFYFLSRGIDRAEAERLLIMAFLAEAVEALGDEAIGATVEPVLEEWLGRRSLAGTRRAA